jgi:hypothetical protein
MSSRGRVQVSPTEDAAGGRAGTGVAVGSGVGVAVAVAVGSVVGVSVGMGVDVLVGGGVDVWVGLAVGGAGVLVGGRNVGVGETDALSCSVPLQLTTRIRMIITAAIALSGTDMFSLLPFVKMVRLLQEPHSESRKPSLCKRSAPTEKMPISRVVPAVRFFLRTTALMTDMPRPPACFFPDRVARSVLARAGNVSPGQTALRSSILYRMPGRIGHLDNLAVGRMAYFSSIQWVGEARGRIGQVATSLGDARSPSACEYRAEGEGIWAHLYFP